MKLIAFGICAAFGLVLYGWGWAIRRVVRAKPTNWPATVASGMAAVVFIRGVLNLTRLAYPWALACVAVAGASLGITAVARGFREKWERSALLRAFPPVTLVPAVAVLAFVVVTQLPPGRITSTTITKSILAITVRMLETGTVFGSPLRVIGLDTLGGQAFLQASRKRSSRFATSTAWTPPLRCFHA